MKNTIVLLIAILFSGFHQVSYAEDNLATMLQPEQVAEDLDQWLTFLDKTHPELSYTVDNVDAFYNGVNALKESIDKPISVLEFWRKVSVFNAVLSDGHTVIYLPKLKELVNQHVKNGDGLFPFSLVLNQDKWVIKSLLDGSPSDLRGAEITHINGQPIDAFMAPLLQRVHGDSEGFRKAVLQRRLATYIWSYYGNFESFELTLNKYGKKQTTEFPSHTSELDLDDIFSEQFSLEILDKSTALLTINTFYWGAKYKDVIEFLHGAFARINSNDIQHLIIDIRENGGGDDGIWIDGILPYIADKTWSTGGRWKKKVLVGRAREGETVGDVVEGENSLREVAADVTKFKGEVSVLISEFTYSSSILFANVIQDHQFGQLVGEATGGKSGQTGGLKMATLTHSKLGVASPFFYLERPKGGSNHEPVKPDVVIQYDKTIPEQLVNKLINQRNLKGG